MARGKAINVKIATPKIIKALENKLAELKSDYANQDKLKEKHEKAVEKWQKDVAKLAISKLSKATDLNASKRWNGDICVNFTLEKDTLQIPDEPEQDFEIMHDWQYKEAVREIENAIRILKMTDEEVVSTSTYNAVAQYL